MSEVSDGVSSVAFQVHDLGVGGKVGCTHWKHLGVVLLACLGEERWPEGLEEWH